MRKYSSAQSGLSVIATILTLLIFSLFIAVAVSLVTTGSNVGVMELQGQQAFDIAEGGIQYALMHGNYCTYNEPSTSLGTGNFTVTSQLYNTTVTDNPLTAGATTINVGSTAGFLIPGIIKIELEYIKCNTKASGIQFTACTRGVAGGSGAAQHNLGATVEQCVVTSTGTVSTGIFGNVQRKVQVTVGK